MQNSLKMKTSIAAMQLEVNIMMQWKLENTFITLCLPLLKFGTLSCF